MKILSELFLFQKFENNQTIHHYNCRTGDKLVKMLVVSYLFKCKTEENESGGKECEEA